LLNKHRPSLLALSRQNLPTARSHDGKTSPANMSATGAYVLVEPQSERQITLIATGSEVSIALEAQARLRSHGVSAAVVSVPCLELFNERDEAYRTEVLGTAPRIVIEAGIRQCWDRLIGDKGGFVGMSGFGASAPAEQLYPHFRITAEHVAKLARQLIT
jgi:transketolase